MVQIYDDRVCELGEGPLWHPGRKELFWFDINASRMLCRDRSWDFDGHVSAAGWTGQDTLLVATERALVHFDLRTGASEQVVPLEPDNPVTRSNDGRADPWGGFWIGTMGKALEREAGAYYRYYKGELRQLWDKVTVPNSTCFSPDRQFAYFTDTPTGRVQRVRLDQDGWPIGDAEVLVDFRPEGFHPDGAVTDADGALWIAIWGGARVVRVGADGTRLADISFPARQMTCPAFSGPTFQTMLVTSAAEGLSDARPQDGQTFACGVDVCGLPEPQVLL